MSTYSWFEGEFGDPKAVIVVTKISLRSKLEEAIVQSGKQGYISSHTIMDGRLTGYSPKMRKVRYDYGLRILAR